MFPVYKYQYILVQILTNHKFTLGEEVAQYPMDSLSDTVNRSTKVESSEAEIVIGVAQIVFCTSNLGFQSRHLFLLGFDAKKELHFGNSIIY